MAAASPSFGIGLGQQRRRDKETTKKSFFLYFYCSVDVTLVTLKETTVYSFPSIHTVASREAMRFNLNSLGNCIPAQRRWTCIFAPSFCLARIISNIFPHRKLFSSLGIPPGYVCGTFGCVYHPSASSAPASTCHADSPL